MRRRLTCFTLKTATAVQPYTFPPWNTKFDINLELTKIKKDNTPSIIFKIHLNETLLRHKNAKIFFTAASKTEKGGSIAIIREKFTAIFRFPESCSINTAKAIAILKTVEFILYHGNLIRNNIILLDSLSTLLSLENKTNTINITKLTQKKSTRQQTDDQTYP